MKARTEDPARSRAQRWIWPLAFATVLLTATVLRLWQLDLKPLHHDEGVNGYFFLGLLRERTIIYDPANYHGPTLYYLGLITTGYRRWIFGPAGIDATALRLVPAVLGIATVWLVLYLQKWIGRLAAAIAATLLALSPGAIYFSRYYIHETPFVFFTLGAVIAGLRYAETQRLKYLIYASVAAALVAATKETVIITAPVLFLAALCTIALQFLRRRSGRSSFQTDRFLSSLRKNVSTIEHPLRQALIALSVFVVAVTLLYSAFLRNFPQGVYDAFRSLQFWTATARAAHEHPWYTYLQWLASADAAIFFIGIPAWFACLWRGRFVAGFFAFWSFGMLAAYSLIPYKSPWLALNALVPLSVVAGAGVSIFFDSARTLLLRKTILGMIVCLLGYSGWAAFRLNFQKYDDDSHPYVYAHTKREFFDLLNKLDSVVIEKGGRNTVTISVLSRDYWPLPWYLRSYRVGYPAKVEPSKDTVLIASHKQIAQVMAAQGGEYEYAGAFPLRPGVDLVLFVRK